MKKGMTLVMRTDQTHRMKVTQTLAGLDLRQARDRAGLSRRKLADLAGLHPDTVRYWERKPRLDLRGYACVRMLKALGLGHLSMVGVFPARDGGISDHYTRAGWGLSLNFAPTPKRCAARTRKGTACRAKALPGKTRCKFHGGASTGPRTVEGRARIAEAQRARWSAWRAGRILSGPKGADAAGGG
jgi:DNA-binding transcriptional regulator YiaG